MRHFLGRSTLPKKKTKGRSKPDKECSSALETLALFGGLLPLSPTDRAMSGDKSHRLASTMFSLVTLSECPPTSETTSCAPKCITVCSRFLTLHYELLASLGRLSVLLCFPAGDGARDTCLRCEFAVR